MTSKIIINGRTIKVPSGNITINGDTILVDGQPIESDELQAKVVNITVSLSAKNNLQTISNCDSVTVTGKVVDISTVNGDVKVHGTVHGNVDTINGNVRAETFIGECRTVNGNITGVKNHEQQS